jgi:hypothetical protein
MSWHYNIDVDSAKIKKLMWKMRRIRDGIPTRDRHWGWRTFPQCFVGSEAAAWIAKESNVSLEFAITMGNSLLHEGE